MRRLIRSKAALAVALLADVLLYGGPHRPDVRLEASIAQALEAQAVATREWLDLQGVVGTAVGLDAGGKAVVKVYLTGPGVASLPATVAGVSVVPEVTGPFVSLAEAPETSEDIDPKRGFPRPVPIGVSTGHPDVTAGTLGARVTDGVRVFALSNNHVYANNNGARKGDNLLQPGVADGGRDPDDLLATLHDYEPIGFCSGLLCPANEIDAAIALTTTDDVGFETPEGGYGSPSARPVDPELGMKVQKYGRTTGHTQGQISGINATIDVNYRTGRARFQGQIVVSGNGFSAGGDSGSLIVSRGFMLNDRRPVGLLFAGSSNSTIANPIGLVLERFSVAVDGG